MAFDRGDRDKTERRLTGWKEIGAFFAKNERTVKRWEQRRGLPVHRLPGNAKTAVFAYPGELDDWLKSSRAVAALAEEVAEPVPIAEIPAALPFVATPARRNGFALAIAAALILAVGLGTVGFLTFHKTDAVVAYQPSQEASELYLTGLYHWNTRTAEGLKQSVAEFQGAIAKDPGYAAAYAGLANAHNLLAQYGVMKPDAAYALAKSEAEQAIALDDRQADGYSALAFATFYGFKDLPRAEMLFKRALALDPQSARTQHWYALVMMHTGVFADSLRAITRAQELDPQSHAILANRGLILFYAGQTAAAIALLQDLTRMVPDFLSPHYYLATIYLDQQLYGDYLAESLKAAKLEGNAALQAAIEAGQAGYSAGGAKGMFAAMLAVQERELAVGKETAFNVARTAALLGDSDVAFQSLQKSLAANEPDLLGIRIDRSLVSLRGDARFEKIAGDVLQVADTAQP